MSLLKNASNPSTVVALLCLSQRRFVDPFKPNCRAPSFSPGAFRECEHLRIRANEPCLFFCRKYDHTMLVIWISERSEDLSADAEIGMVHMRPLRYLRK